MKVMIDRGLFNNDDASSITGFSDLREALKEYTPLRRKSLCAQQKRWRTPEQE
jgi:hypothetical protein